MCLYFLLEDIHRVLEIIHINLFVKTFHQLRNGSDTLYEKYDSTAKAVLKNSHSIYIRTDSV